MRRRLFNTFGFTSVESILTVGVLGVGLLGGMIVMQNTTLNTVNGDLHTLGTQLANEKIEEMMIDAHENGYDVLVSAAVTEDLNDDHPGFSRYVSVYEVDVSDLSTPDVESGVKRIDVTVMWGDQEYQHVDLSTIVHEE